MVSSLAWLDMWLLGIETFDADHRELVGLVNRLIEMGRDPDGAPTAPRPTPNVEGLGAEQLAHLHLLIEALRRHFRAEEAFLDGIDYPEYPEHRSEHALHLAELVDLSRRIETDQLTGRPRRLDQEHLASIKGWLLNHIAEDQRFARYYFEQFGTDAAEDHRRSRQASTGSHLPTARPSGGTPR